MGANELPTVDIARRELPNTRVTMGIVGFMRKHLQDKEWTALKWTRQPDTFLYRISDWMERQQGGIFHMGYQGFVTMLNDWPDNEFVEDEDRRINRRRIFREEWEAMRASGCIGEDEGNYYRLNHFDYVPPRDED